MRRSSGTSMKRMTQAEALFRCARLVLAATGMVGRRRTTYRAKAAKMMSNSLKVMQLAMPSAKQRIMLRIPSLFVSAGAAHARFSHDRFHSRQRWRWRIVEEAIHGEVGKGRTRAVVRGERKVLPLPVDTWRTQLC